MLRKSLDFKLAVALFIILGLSFITMIVSFNHIHTAHINELLKQFYETEAAENGDIQAVPEINTPVLGKTIISGACFIFVLLSMMAMFHFIVLKPLKFLTHNLERSIKGDERDLTFRLNDNREDEIGVLADCFDAFISNLDEVIMKIGSKTETVSAVSSEVFIVSGQMDEESTDLYSRSNSVAAAAEEMNTSMHTVAAASEEASTNISIVADAAGQMQTNITGVTQNCDEAKKISNNARLQVDTATEKVSHLGEAAQEIGKVTQVITEIAEQTNLLALNATIEAARAGEAGKGFAVVADEIKNLASQTSTATQTIRKQIEGIQTSTEETVHEVGNISQVITHVDEIVNEIVTAIDEQSKTATEVASNIEQASIGISEVNENVAQSSQVAAEIASDIAQVDSIAAEMSTKAGNMTKSARDLDDLSSTLRKMITVFLVSLDKSDDISSKVSNIQDIPDLMPWTSKLETSIPVIDTQHKELVRMLNQMHKAMRKQQGSNKLNIIIQGLADYTVMHFSVEEKLFRKFGYPEYEKHKKIHEELVATVLKFKSDFNSGKATVTMDLMDFLTDWLKTHIMKTDMAYVPFLKDKM